MYWLYNNKSQKKYEKLSLSEIADILLSQSESELNYWFAWEKGWKNWKLVKDVPDLMNLYRVSEEPPELPPPPMEIPQVIEDEPKASSEAQAPSNSEVVAAPTSSTPTETQTSIVDDENSQENINKRLHKRHNIRFKVIIESDVLTFRSFTSNISLGGLALEHSIPDKILTDQCKIYVSDLDNSETIMFNIKPIRKSGSDLKYFSFENLDDYYQKKLETWITNHSKA